MHLPWEHARAHTRAVPFRVRSTFSSSCLNSSRAAFRSGSRARARTRLSLPARAILILHTRTAARPAQLVPSQLVSANGANGATDRPIRGCA